ncbi:MAG: hypothetical protein ACTSUJ_06730 [Candidatus Njordarchaeales archaeon]
MPRDKDRKKRRSIFDAFFSGSLFDEIEEFFEDVWDEFKELGDTEGGYSIEITYVNGRPVVRAKISDNIDREEFERMLKERYPGAEIIIEGGRGEKFKVMKREKEEKRVEITLKNQETIGVEKKTVTEEKKTEGSLFDMLYGKRKAFIKREDE